MILGIDAVTFIVIFGVMALEIVGTVVYALTGRYEGDKIEQEYEDAEHWYKTF